LNFEILFPADCADKFADFGDKFLRNLRIHEKIDLGTIKSSIKEFTKKFLDLSDCIIEIENNERFEKSLENYKEYQRVFKGAKPIEISFNEELILRLSTLWKRYKSGKGRFQSGRE
jgi:peptide methionine sulfoxide reductase MsrA